jgi:uncharacterized protein YbbC (DUF1343 family)
MSFATGLDAVVADHLARFRGQRVGLLTHPAALSTDSCLRSARDLFATAEGVKLVAIFGPEHGLSGEAQDLIPVTGESADGLRVHSLYGDTFDSLKPTLDMLAGLDVFVIDLVDVGSRYYTFQATMLYCLEACAAVGLPVVILDRPNPLGRTVEGPTIRPGFESFVGPHPIATRHGMTMGELARLYRAERAIDVDLTVVPCAKRCVPAWRIPPSPNMPTRRTASVYPGMCLVEGTNLSEGRGTTRPFEYVGYPAVKTANVLALLSAAFVDGFEFLPVTFRPTFQKHAGQSCNGVFIVRSGKGLIVRAGMDLLWAFKSIMGDEFRWRTERYEFVDTVPAIDLLFGSDRERLALDAGVHPDDITQEWWAEEDEFRERRRPYLSEHPA